METVVIDEHGIARMERLTTENIKYAAFPFKLFGYTIGQERICCPISRLQ